MTVETKTAIAAATHAALIELIDSETMTDSMEEVVGDYLGRELTSAEQAEADRVARRLFRAFRKLDPMAKR